MKQNRKTAGKIMLWGALLLFLFSGNIVAISYVPYAYAALDYGTVRVPRPLSNVTTSTFRMRTHPNTGVYRPHKGVDIRAQTPTPITNLGNYEKIICTSGGGWGDYAEVYYECNVTSRLAHLSKCDAETKTIVTGQSGNVDGPHLHHELLLGGAAVDPEEAYGQNLCDPKVREKLIKSANDKLNGLAGKDGVTERKDDDGKHTHVPSNPDTGGQTIPDGNGGTITLPPGGGYTIIEGKDGRVIVIPDQGKGGEAPLFPPGDPADLTPEGSVEHEVTGCATDTWKAMVNQSVLQARREVVMNQRFIAKADSVMAYACLQIALDRVREDLGPVFSETKRWVNVEVDIIGETVTLNKELGETSLDGALVNAVYNPYETWIASNFGHDFLGGLMEETEEGDEDNHGHDQSYSGCNTMQDVWKAAKCMNLTDEPMFPTFKDLIDKDPRKYPHGYSCNHTGITQEMIDIAKGKEVKFDKVKTYLDMLYPDDEGNCHPPIRTGVTVVRMEAEGKTVSSCPPHIPGCETNADNERISKEKTYQDGLCITVGCSYQNSDGGAGECVVK